MQIKNKSKIRQLFCKHDFQEGILSKAQDAPFFNLSGDTYTTICVKCGKIKKARFVKTADIW